MSRTRYGQTVISAHVTRHGHSRVKKSRLETSRPNVKLRTAPIHSKYILAFGGLVLATGIGLSVANDKARSAKNKAIDLYIAEEAAALTARMKDLKAQQHSMNSGGAAHQEEEEEEDEERRKGKEKARQEEEKIKRKEDEETRQEEERKRKEEEKKRQEEEEKKQKEEKKLEDEKKIISRNKLVDEQLVQLGKTQTEQEKAQENMRQKYEDEEMRKKRYVLDTPIMCSENKIKKIAQ